MQKVIVRPLQHRGQECMAFYFEISSKLQDALQKTSIVKFSKTHQCWYAPLSRENYSAVTSAIKGLAIIDHSALHEYLSHKKKQKSSCVTATGEKIQSAKIFQGRELPGKQKTILKGKVINDINNRVLPAMEQHLRLKGYSGSTIRTYLNEMAVFLKTIGHYNAHDFTIPRIKDYLQYCYEKLGLTENSLHSRMNALKFYYEQVLKKEKFFWEIPRPKKAVQLPKVLSKEEIIRLIKAIENQKHKTMIMLGYACGLRVSEITGVQLKDLDADRMLLYIRRAKGKKDRVVSLSPVMLVMIREYMEKYKPAQYLFEGQVKGGPYSIRSLQLIIQAAKEKAGIKKDGSMHMLRHSFATHLIDKGTDVVFIQKLLGHNNIKTTLRYLHVTNKDILKVLSPIEDIKDFL